MSKVKIEKYVADYIEERKLKGGYLYFHIPKFGNPKFSAEWFISDSNIQDFVKAWNEGYEIVKEPKIKYWIRTNYTKLTDIVEQTVYSSETVFKQNKEFITCNFAKFAYVSDKDGQKVLFDNKEEAETLAELLDGSVLEFQFS